MIIIQYGSVFGVFTDDGVLIEGDIPSRHEAVEARDRLTADAVPAEDEVVVDVEKPKRGRKARAK